MDMLVTRQQGEKGGGGRERERERERERAVSNERKLNT